MCSVANVISKQRLGYASTFWPGPRSNKRTLAPSQIGCDASSCCIPKTVLDPPTYDTFSPLVCSRPVIFLRGNGHRPDKFHFLRPPKLALESALYSKFSPKKKSHDTFPPHLTFPKGGIVEIRISCGKCFHIFLIVWGPAFLFNVSARALKQSRHISRPELPARGQAYFTAGLLFRSKNKGAQTETLGLNIRRIIREYLGHSPSYEGIIIGMSLRRLQGKRQKTRPDKLAPMKLVLLKSAQNRLKID